MHNLRSVKAGIIKFL